MKKYYSIAGMRVAMRDDSGVYYFVVDHLASSSVLMDDTGTLLSQNRYMPFGEVREISGLTPITETDFGYTGQRNYAGFGLYYYVARWYDPAIGRFVQADSVVPDPGSALGYDRYAYTLNSPLMYVDPSGHRYCDWDGGGCEDHGDDGLYGSDDDWRPGTWSYGGGGNRAYPGQGYSSKPKKKPKIQPNKSVNPPSDLFIPPTPPWEEPVIPWEIPDYYYDPGRQKTIDGIGFRVEATGGAFFNLDGNLDIILVNGTWDVLITPGFEVGPEGGGGITGGILLFFNVPDREAASGVSTVFGASFEVPIGLELEYAVGGENPDGTHATSVYVGGGAGIKAGGHITTSYTFSLFEDFMPFVKEYLQ